MTGVYQPARGVHDDFEKLLTDFVATKSVRFEEFAKLWREQKMSFIFSGRQDDLECREFTEECLRIASEFWMPPYSFQTRIAALYLMYALYAKQPFNPKVKLRVTMEMWREADTLLQDIREQQHQDVEFIYHKMLHEQAFQHVACLRPKSIGTSVLDTTAATVGSESALTEQAENVLTELMHSDHVQVMELVHERYLTTKQSLGENVRSSVDMIHGDLLHNMRRIASIHKTWCKAINTKQTKQASSESGKRDGTDKSPSKSRRQKIKEKAYANVGVASRSRRYRQVTSEGATSAVQSPKKKNKKKKQGTGMSNADDDTHKCSQGNDSTGTHSETTSVLLHMPKLTTSDDSEEDTTL